MNVNEQESLLSVCRKTLTEAVDEVSRALHRISHIYGVPFEAVRNYLEYNEPNLIKTIDILQNECDSDIFAKILSGTASHNECNDWIRSVLDWKYLYLEGISRYEQFYVMAEVA